MAERAGVSVGTLYQYYPNKRALLAALLSRHLDEVVATVSGACAALRGSELEPMVEGLVAAFVAAKLRRAEVSRALHAPMAEADGAALARAAEARGAEAVAALLATCRDLSVPAPDLAAAVLGTALSALARAALEAEPDRLDPERLRRHATLMVLGYLRLLGRPRSRSVPLGPGAAPG